MKKLRKFIALLMCISMLWGVLTACNKADTVDTAEGTDAQTEADTGEDPGNDPVDPDKETLIIYPEFDARIERDYTYSVSVTQGDRTESLPVYNHTEDSQMTRGNEGAADEYRRFSSFAFEGEPVRVDIKVNRDFTSYSVMPSAKNFKNEFKDGVISVWLDKPEYFVVRLDDKDSTNISILADAPENEEDIPEPGENVYIIDGWYEVEGGFWKITEPNTTIYIKPGAVLNARLFIGADNCKILGRGAIVDPWGDIYRYDESSSGASASEYCVIYLRTVDNTVIDGIHMLDSKAFNIMANGKWGTEWMDGTRITNVKVLSSQLSSDGICLNVSQTNASCERCFIYCGDNAIVYAASVTYRDITVGTTCNAIFPQGDMVNSLIENIYIFRADEGIINQDYQYGDTTPVDNHVIRNVYADDVNRTGYFLALYVPDASEVVSANGGLTIENAYLPKMSSIGANYFYHNTVTNGDYAVNMKNVYIDGKLITEANSTTTGKGLSYGSNTFSYTADAAEQTSLGKIKNTVNYKCPDKVMIGKYLVLFTQPIVKKDNTVYVPYEQMKAELRTENDAETVEINGIKYVDVNKLVAAGMAEDVDVSENKVSITANAPDAETNLLLPDTGIISKYTKSGPAGREWLIVSKDANDMYIYKTVRHSDAYGDCGVFRLIDEELHKYGKGKYKLIFQAKSVAKPQGDTVTAIFDCASGDVSKTFDMGYSWQTYELEFTVTELKLSDSLLSIKIGSTSNEFDIKDIQLVKVS